MPREFFEVFKVPAERIRDDFEIELKVAMHQDVAESCYRAESRAKLRGQYLSFYETVDCRRIVGCVESKGGG